MAKILLIDNDENLLEVISSYLIAYNHTIVGVTSGKQGIIQIATQNFDIVITELMMKGVDGFDVLSWLCQDELNNPKKIILSGCNEVFYKDYNRNLCEKYNVDKVLTKPISLKSLRDEIHALINSST